MWCIGFQKVQGGVTILGGKAAFYIFKEIFSDSQLNHIASTVPSECSVLQLMQRINHNLQ